jgi:hypothetical protein
VNAADPRDAVNAGHAADTGDAVDTVDAVDAAYTGFGSFIVYGGYIIRCIYCITVQPSLNWQLSAFIQEGCCRCTLVCVIPGLH